MKDNIGKIMDDAGLTFDEEIYYANYGLVDECDLCHNMVAITNYHEGDNFLTLTGSKLYCCKCL